MIKMCETGVNVQRKVELHYEFISESNQCFDEHREHKAQKGRPAPKEKSTDTTGRVLVP